MSDAAPDIISIRYDGIDITADVEIAATRFSTGVNSTPGACTVRIRDLARVMSFTTGKNLSLDVNGQRKWDGFVASVRRGYYDTGFRSLAAVPRYLEIRGVDVNVLFEKRFLYDPTDPTRIELEQFPAGTPDSTVILHYLNNYLDLRDDFITQFAIQTVDTPALDCADNANCIGASAGWSWGDFMRIVSRNIGSIFYLDPDRTVIYTDVDSPSAVAGISDKPGVGEVGCRDLEIELDGASLRNDAMVWGAGQGHDHIVFSRSTDEASIEEHGLWQYGDFRPSIYRQATVNRIAASAVYGSPQSKRGGKDNRVSVRCRVFDDRFRVAQKVSVRSEVHGFEDVLPIRRMDISFPTKNRVAYDLQLSHEIDPIWSTYEFFFPDFNFTPPRIRIPNIDVVLRIPKFTDSETGDEIAINPYPRNCVGGRVEYSGSYATDDDGNVYGFDNPGPYSPDVSMFATRGAHPEVEDPASLGYLGYNRYLIDGNSGTFLVGYRRHCADSIAWDLKVPLPVSGVEIVQAAGGWEAAGYDPDPLKHMAVELTVVASDPGPPVIVAQGTFGEGTFLSLGWQTLVRRRWEVHSSGGSQWDLVPPAVGDGNWGTNWVVNEARLFTSCIDIQEHSPGGTMPPYIPGGPTSGNWVPEETETVPDSPGARCYSAGLPYMKGSSQLFIGGVFMRPGVDYFEYPYLGKFCIADGIDVDNKRIWFGAVYIPELEGGP